MKNTKKILEKYSIKDTHVIKEEKGDNNEPDISELQDTSIQMLTKIRGYVKKFGNLLNPQEKKALGMLGKLFHNRGGYVNEEYTMHPDSFKDMSDRDVEQLSQKAEKSNTDIKLMEDENNLYKFRVTASFNVFVEQPDPEDAVDKAELLLAELEDGSDIQIDRVSDLLSTSRKMYEGKEYTVESILDEINMRKKGLTITETVNVKDFLKRKNK